MFVSVFLLGSVFGIFVTSKIFINNIPEKTSISIGRLQVKGKGNEVSTDVILENTEVEKTEKRKGIFKKK